MWVEILNTRSYFTLVNIFAFEKLQINIFDKMR